MLGNILKVTYSRLTYGPFFSRKNELENVNSSRNFQKHIFGSIRDIFSLTAQGTVRICSPLPADDHLVRRSVAKWSQNLARKTICEPGIDILFSCRPINFLR